MSSFEVKLDKAFTVEDSLRLIDDKERSSCSCGNKSFILYFINLEMPVMFILAILIQGQGALKLCKVIRERINEGTLDRGFLIVNSGINEM